MYLNDMIMNCNDSEVVCFCDITEFRKHDSIGHGLRTLEEHEAMTEV